MAKSQWYEEGYGDGFSAAYDTDWQPGEMRARFEADTLGEVVGAILENWQQMADTVYYQGLTDRQLDRWEEGFSAGFLAGVKRQLPLRIRRSINPCRSGRRNPRTIRMRRDRSGRFVATRRPS